MLTGRSASMGAAGIAALSVPPRGAANLGGTLWEWTVKCMQNGERAENGAITACDPYCGVRIAGGRHPAAGIDFVRDASVGDCAVGMQPDHLGFRLVRGR